jgi:hypothetical protein
MAIAAGSGPGLVADPGTTIAHSAAAPTIGRDFPARRQALSHLLSVRGTAGAPNAGHAAHAPARAGPTLSARLRGE